MVARVNVRWLSAVIALGVALAGCSGPEARDLSKVEEQPAANLEAGKSATTIADWAAANPNNGAPGSGEGGK